MDASVDDVFFTSKETLSELLEVGFAAGAWSLLDVCRMCASSKLLCSSWMQLLRMQPSPTWLLAAVADAAQASTEDRQDRAIAMVTWLLSTLPEAKLAEHPSIPAGLLSIPCMPLELAEQLVSSGVRIPLASIIAAARARIEGVEVWVEAQQLDVPQHEEPPPELMYDLLHLTINSNKDTAETVLKLMPEQLPDDEAIALLQTAVERHSPRRPYMMLSLIGVLEDYDHLPVMQLLPVLLRALELDARQAPQAADLYVQDPYYSSIGTGPLLRHLSTLPVFQQLSPDAAAGLVQAALKAGNSYTVQLLWSTIPGVRAVGPTRLADLLQAAAAAGDEDSLKLLARIPAFHEVQPAALASALMAAVKPGYATCVNILQESSAAAQLAAGDYELLLELLMAALLADQADMMPELLELSTSRINLARLLVLLQAALQHCPASFMYLYQLPAAAHIQAKQLGQLLRWAGRWFRHDIVYDVLNWHRAWSNVCPEDKLVGLLQLALQQGANCRNFCVHPCAAAVDAELAWLLLHFAVATEQSSNLEALLLLPAASKLTTANIVELMMVAVMGADGPACLATMSKAAAPAAAAAVASTAAGGGSRSSSDLAAPKEPQQQQYTFRSLSMLAAVAAAAAPSRPGAAASRGNAAASSGGAAAMASADGSFSSQGGDSMSHDCVTLPMQKLSLSAATAARFAAPGSACLTVLCQWDAAAAIGADGLLLLLQAADKRAVRPNPSPVASQLDPDYSAVQQLCSSKAAASISSAAELMPLLELLLKYHNPVNYTWHVDTAKLLMHCPAAAAIDAAMLGELLRVTLSSACIPCADPAFKSVSGVDLPHAWLAAVAATAKLSAEQQLELQQAAAAAAAAHQLASLPQAVAAVARMDISAGLLQGLLDYAITQRDASLAAEICSCPTAAQMSSSSIKTALKEAAYSASLPPAVAAIMAETAAAAAPAATAAAAAATDGLSGHGAAAAGVKQGGKASRRCKKARRRGRKC